MSSLNKVSLIGRLGNEVDLKHTASGKSVANFSLATTLTTGTPPQEQTEWHRVVAWDKLADNCKKFLGKGKMAYVEGRISTRKWEKDGVAQYTTEIIAHQVLFLSPKNTNEDKGSGTHATAQAQAVVDDVDDLPF